MELPDLKFNIDLFEFPRTLGKLKNASGLSTSTTFQLGFIPLIPDVLTCISDFLDPPVFLKFPSKIKGIPFIAYNSVSVPSKFILILCVGTSAANSLSCGICEVCNLDLPLIPVSFVTCDPNCKVDLFDEEIILT